MDSPRSRHRPARAVARRLLDEVRQLRDKARRSDLFADELALWNFFDKRLPDDVFSGKLFEQWRRSAEARAITAEDAVA